MSEHTLPDDSSRWPSDPFELLGVPRNVSELDLKRAYTKLIRKFKPEHAPDEFRKIREAYEAAIDMSRWYRVAPPFEETRTELPFSPLPKHDEAADRGTDVDRPVRPARVNPVDDAWESAIAGDWLAAYTALVELTSSYPPREDIPLRLYWLLALRPALDETRTRHDWLAEALVRSHFEGAAIELYQRELATDPATAFDKPYHQLLKPDRSSGYSVVGFAYLRMQTAGLERLWAVLESDLAVLVERANDLPEASWLNYIVTLVTWTIFDKPPVYFRCEKLLSSLKHLELRYSYIYDRIDELMFVSNIFNDDELLPDPIRWVVACSYNPHVSWQTVVPPACEFIATDPLRALKFCDQALATSGSRQLLLRFDGLLSDYAEERFSAHPPSVGYTGAMIRGMIAARFLRTSNQEYHVQRSAFLTFLISEGLEPSEVISACRVSADEIMRKFGSRFADDSISQLVCRAGYFAT